MFKNNVKCSESYEISFREFNLKVRKSQQFIKQKKQKENI